MALTSAQSIPAATQKLARTAAPAKEMIGNSSVPFFKGAKLAIATPVTLSVNYSKGVLKCRAAVAADKAPASAEVKKVRLGQSPVEVPQLGVGTWSWGDKFNWNEGEWDDRKEKAAKYAFETAMDSGLTFFDSAEFYGTAQFGGDDSEAILGRCIAERCKRGGERPVVATKYGAVPWRVGRKTVLNALKASLDRLQLPYVDLYQIHWPGLWGNEGYIEGLADCVELGLAKAVGVSNFSEKRLRDAHAQLAARGVPLASNQVHYSLLYRSPEDSGVKAACDELGVSLIAYSPLAQGILTGKYGPDRVPSGPRARNFNADYLRTAVPLLNRLKELGSKYDKSTIQVALNWLIFQGNVIPIPGAKSQAQAEEFAGALGWSLEDSETRELRKLAELVPKFQGFPVETW